MGSNAAEWTVSELRSEHNRAEFSCGYETLDNFIQIMAGQHQKKSISKTVVATRLADSNLRVCGYYSLAAGKISLNDLTESQKKKLPKHPIPVVLLGRLAVDTASQGKGLGEFLLLDAMARSVSIADKIGIYAIEVDAIDNKAKEYYKRYDFEELSDDPRHLYIPIKKLQKLKLV